MSVWARIALPVATGRGNCHNDNRPLHLHFTIERSIMIYCSHSCLPDPSRRESSPEGSALARAFGSIRSNRRLFPWERCRGGRNWVCASKMYIDWMREGVMRLVRHRSLLSRDRWRHRDFEPAHNPWTGALVPRRCFKPPSGESSRALVDSRPERRPPRVAPGLSAARSPARRRRALGIRSLPRVADVVHSRPGHVAIPFMAGGNRLWTFQ